MTTFPQFASAITANPSFALVNFHVSLEVSELSAGDIQSILAPLNERYRIACHYVCKHYAKRKLGSVKLSLASGEDKALVEYFREEGEDSGHCRVVICEGNGQSENRVALRGYLGPKVADSGGVMDASSGMMQSETDFQMLDT